MLKKIISISALLAVGLFLVVNELPPSKSAGEDMGITNGWSQRPIRLERTERLRRLRELLGRQDKEENDYMGSGDTKLQRLGTGNKQREYLLYLPVRDDLNNLPLVIALHGGQTNGGRLMKTSGLNKLADKEGFIVAYPNAYNKNWNDGRKQLANGPDDVEFINNLIEELSSRRNINTRKVYVIGISNGSFMAQRLACELSDRLAAISVVAGAMPYDLKNMCRPKVALPVIMFAGTADKFIPWNGGEAERGKGGKLFSPIETARWWAKENNCKSTITTNVESVDASIGDDKTYVKMTRFSNCNGQNKVVFYTIVNGGHTWPGGNAQPEWLVGKTTFRINASKLSWDFFREFSR